MNSTSNAAQSTAPSVATASRGKVLFLVSEDWYFVSHRLDLARAVIAAGYEVVVATRVGSHADLIADAGVKLRPLALDRAGLNPVRDLATLRQIVHIYRQEAPDIVHHVALKPAIYGSLAARLVGIRRIVNALAGLGYVFSSQGPRARLLRWLIKPALRIALGGRDTRLIVQNSDDLRRTVAEGLVQASRVRLIRGAGVDPSNYRQVEIASDTPLVILPGRLLWEKGVGVFAGAARLLRERGVNARFALVGRTDPANPSSVDLADIEAWVRQGVIEYWGWRDDMPEVFAQAQIVCLPTSYGEGLPKSLLEAAASGCAIVVTDVPGCREIVTHGKTGWLVPVRDVGALADALQQAIERPELRKQYGGAARAQVVSDFSMARVARETIAIYDELTVGEAGRRVESCRSADGNAMVAATRRRWVSQKGKQARRVTVVSAQLADGGAERVAIDLCCYLRDNGRNVTLLTLSGDMPDAYRPPEGVLRQRLEARRLPPSIFHRLWYLVNRVIGIRSKIASDAPDVVVTFIDKVNILVLFSLFGTGIPVVISERIHPAYNPIARVWKLTRQLIYPLARVVTVQTEEGAAWFRRHSLIKHPVVIANAVRSPRDFDGEAGPATGGTEATARRPFVLAIGRLAEQKGFDLLLEAFHRAGLAAAGWRLVILGAGPERAALEQQARTLGIGDKVMFPGFVDIGPFLRNADLFVMSSRYEGFPNALMEAMQVGLPCISFDCPSGPRDLIKNEQNGLLVPPQDVSALTAALVRMAADPELRKRLGAAASGVNERYSQARIYGKWLALLDDIAAGKR